MSKRHDALAALFSAVAGAAGGTTKVLKNAVIPEKIPEGGLIILRDGVPGEPRITLSPTRYEYEHAAEIEVFFQATDEAVRVQAIDQLLSAVSAALSADISLGGKVEWTRWSAPETASEAMMGAAHVSGAAIKIWIRYSTSDPLQ